MIDLYSNGSKHQTHAMRVLSKGVMDDSQLLSYDQKHRRNGDVCVAWGTRHMNLLKTIYKKVVIIERGYFNNRLNYYSFGVGGLNGLADFNNANRPADRWQQHGVELKPWKRTGEHYLIMGQVPGDMSIQGVDIDDWYLRMFNELKEKTDKPIYFRAHPQARKHHSVILTMDGDLDQVLKHCAGVITYNSNSGVDAAIAGVPVMAQDIGSMAWGVAAKYIDQLINFTFPDRMQWAYNLAYTQWTIEEIENGTAWGHLCQR